MDAIQMIPLQQKTIKVDKDNMDVTDMLRFLKTMDENANNKVVNLSVLEQHTNKSFLIGKFTAVMESVDSRVDAVQHSSTLKLQQQTVTPNIIPANVVSLNVNNCIQIKELLESVNEPICGKFLLCRTICPPCKVTALMTVVDDPDGKLSAQLILYNFVPNVSALSCKDAYHYLPVGTILAIMNPWLKSTSDGGFAVRCDNPSQVVMLNTSKHHELLSGIMWKGKIPFEYQRMELTDGDKISALDWKRIGNDHFRSKRFKESVTAYTNGIDSENIESELWLDLLSNRSAAYLKLSNCNLALTDAQTVLNVDKVHLKCIYRKASALFGMSQYEDAVSFLNNASADVSKQDQEIIGHLIVKGKQFIAQSASGEYPWKDIYENKLEDHCHDIAEYQGAVVVRDSPNKGRGLFAIESIKAGQLILASKAFAVVVDNRRDGLYVNCRSGKWLVTRCQTELVTKIAQFLNDCPEKIAEFYSLYGGVEYGIERSSKDQVDVKRIEEILRYNAFGKGGFSEAGTNLSGIWISPSFINHSCVDANSSWTQNGDFLFVRAFHDISKGQEILISYDAPLANVTQKKLERYEFTCDCRLCKRDQLDSPKMITYRSDLKSKLETILAKSGNDETNFPYHEALKVTQLLYKSRADAPELNIFFLDDIVKLAIIEFKNGFYLKCASTLENVYNAIEEVAALIDLTWSTIINIISSYRMAGDKPKAMLWYKVLKQKTILYYGSLNVIEVLAPSNGVSMLENFQ